MAWARQHSPAFGGDPERVTIFGESAGGNSVINHLAQPASFFRLHACHRGKWRVQHRGAAARCCAVAVRVAACVGEVLRLDCLLEMDAAAVERASSGGWGPTIDGESLSAAPTDLIAEGKYNNKAPVLIGSVTVTRWRASTVHNNVVNHVARNSTRSRRDFDGASSVVVIWTEDILPSLRGFRTN